MRYVAETIELTDDPRLIDALEKTGRTSAPGGVGQVREQIEITANPETDGLVTYRLTDYGPDSVEYRFAGHELKAAFALNTKPDLIVIRPWERLLPTAELLLNGGHHAVAVVVSMTACESIVSRAMYLASEKKGVPEIAESSIESLSSYAIGTNKRMQKLYKTLTGDPIEQQPYWGDFIEATRRGNEMVHKDVDIDHDDAKRFVEAVKKIVEHIEDVNEMKS